jgi:hypothetical protein
VTKTAKLNWIVRLRRWFCEKQNNRCAVCGLLFKANSDDVKERPVLDHSHISKRVRGALCQSCNYGIGFLKDSPELMKSAIAYLEADYSRNPPHPEEESESIIGLAPRDFSYENWFSLQNGFTA